MESNTFRAVAVLLEHPLTTGQQTSPQQLVNSTDIGCIFEGEILMEQFQELDPVLPDIEVVFEYLQYSFDKHVGRYSIGVHLIRLQNQVLNDDDERLGLVVRPLGLRLRLLLSAGMLEKCYIVNDCANDSLQIVRGMTHFEHSFEDIDEDLFGFERGMSLTGQNSRQRRKSVEHLLQLVYGLVPDRHFRRLCLTTQILQSAHNFVHGCHGFW